MTDRVGSCPLGGHAPAGARPVPFSSVAITRGPYGVEKIHALGELSSYERQLVSQAVEGLQGNIAKGVSFKPTKL